MGQKVHPYGLRLGIIRDWDSRWYAEKDYARLLHEDLEIKRIIRKHLKHAAISRIELERMSQVVRVNIYTARPGIIIGHKGKEVDNLVNFLQKKTGKKVTVNIREIKVPELDAQLVAENIASQLVARVSFRRAMKRAMSMALERGAEGARIIVSGRLGGAEIARSEGIREGKVPLHTLRADIDYGFAEAFTTYGTIGVKVWIYKGEIIGPQAEETEE